MLQDKSWFQGNDYCAAYIWHTDTEIWFYFKTNGSSLKMVGFEKKPKKPNNAYVIFAFVILQEKVMQ